MSNKNDGEPGTYPEADIVLTSAATSLRISCAILVPSRMRADIDWGPGVQLPALKSYTAESNTHHGRNGIRWAHFWVPQ